VSAHDGVAHLWREERVAALAGRFRLVHGDVGVTKQVGRAGPAVAAGGDAGAQVDGEEPVADLDRQLEAAQHAVEDLDRHTLDVVVAGAHEDRELIAAEARYEIFGTDRAREAAADGAQEFVTDGVAERVVDDLEVVEVDEEHRDAAACTERGPDTVGEHRAVGQAG
jgi:hypothetical protein